MVVAQTDADSHLVNADLFVPQDSSTMLYYTFNGNGTMSISVVVNSRDSVTDNGTWSLSADGELCSEMLPNGLCWNVNWITSNTMILSRNDLGTEEGNYYYQLQFVAVPSAKK